jgi:hypothetical protein
MGRPMAFQHAKDIMHVKVPSSTTVQKMFHVKFLWYKPLLFETQRGKGDEVLSSSYQA